MGNRGSDEIKKHPFFKGFDFTANIRKTKAPYVPVIKYPTDTSNFDPVDIDFAHDYENNDYMPCSEDQQKESGKRRAKDKKIPEHAFFEFTFRRFFDAEETPLPICMSTDITISPAGTLKLDSLKNLDKHLIENDEQSNEPEENEVKKEANSDGKDEEKKDAVYV